MEKMQYNECGICGAKNGKAGLLVTSDVTNNIPACLNCYDTANSRKIVIHSYLTRTKEELEKTISFFDNKQKIVQK